MGRNPELYTPEVVIFQSSLNKVDLSKPISVYEDTAGHHAVVDGNHRAYQGYTSGVELKREVIGTLSKDVSRDPYYHPISELKIIEQ